MWLLRQTGTAAIDCVCLFVSKQGESKNHNILGDSALIEGWFMVTEICVSTAAVMRKLMANWDKSAIVVIIF